MRCRVMRPPRWHPPPRPHKAHSEKFESVASHHWTDHSRTAFPRVRQPSPERDVRNHRRTFTGSLRRHRCHLCRRPLPRIRRSSPARCLRPARCRRPRRSPPERRTTRTAVRIRELRCHRSCRHRPRSPLPRGAPRRRHHVRACVRDRVSDMSVGVPSPRLPLRAPAGGTRRLVPPPPRRAEVSTPNMAPGDPVPPPNSGQFSRTWADLHSAAARRPPGVRPVPPRRRQ